MLEEMKEALISDMQQELQKRKQIDKEINMIIEERNQKQQQSFETLSKMKADIDSKSRNLIRRIKNSKKIQKLCIEYANLSNIAREEISLLNEKIETLYQEIYDLSHDEAIIEREIERIRCATTFQELGITEREALNYLKSDEKKVIKSVFKNLRDSQSLETSTDIDRSMNTLYQTNKSPFVVAMQKISIDDLIKELIDIEIMVDEDKIKFLKQLKEYAEEPNKVQYPNISGQERTDRLDNNFYNQVQEDLGNMNKYSSYPPILISKIVTLAVLTSMAKSNKQHAQIQK